MLPFDLLKKSRAQIPNFFLLLAVTLMSYFHSLVAFAQAAAPPPQPGPTFINVSGLSAESMLINIAKNIPNLMRLVTAIAYVLGMIFIIRGVIMLKHFGESRTMMSREHSLMGPLTILGVGVALLYIPTSVNVGLSTFWTEPNPYGMTIPSDPYGDFLRVVYLIVQFIGAVAFIRGLVILSHVGQGHGQGKLSQGLMHIIGGIFCINIYQFVQMIMYTLGLGIST